MCQVLSSQKKAVRLTESHRSKGMVDTSGNEMRTSPVGVQKGEAKKASVTIL